MRIFYTNLFDSATLTHSSEAAGLPAENAQSELPTKVWRTGSTLGTEYIVGDMATAKAVTSVIIHNHNLIAGDTNIKFQMNATDSWGSPSFTTDLTRVAKTFGAAFASQSYRYFRIVFDKATAGSSRDIGRIFVGTYLEPSLKPDFSGLSWIKVDTSVVGEAMSGAEYAEIRYQRNDFKVPFGSLPESDFTGIRTMFDAVGVRKPLFVQIDTVSPLDTFYYVRIAKDIDGKVKAYGSEYYWNMAAIELREQIT